MSMPNGPSNIGEPRTFPVGFDPYSLRVAPFTGLFFKVYQLFTTVISLLSRITRQ